jgi:hypothetical protein
MERMLAMNEAHRARPAFDRSTEDVGNIVEFGHVNTRIPDQRLATIFYVMGLGLTRDPYLSVGVDNMWINAGTCQFHLPTGQPQVLRGTTGLVLPDITALAARLESVKPRLKETKFGFHATKHVVEATCPWGNRIRCHAPDQEKFGPITLGMSYVEIAAPSGTSAGTARFYQEILETPATAGEDARGRFAKVPVGRSERLIYRETDREMPPFDGHHVQITLRDFSGPYRRLAARGLITAEDNQHQYRFQNIADLDSGEVLTSIEHEVRSMRHPMYARVLVNRNPAQTQMHYVSGRDAWNASMP